MAKFPHPLLGKRSRACVHCGRSGNSPMGSGNNGASCSEENPYATPKPAIIMPPLYSLSITFSVLGLFSDRILTRIAAMLVIPALLAAIDVWCSRSISVDNTGVLVVLAFNLASICGYISESFLPLFFLAVFASIILYFSAGQALVKLYFLKSHSSEVRTINSAKLAGIPGDSETSLEGPIRAAMYFIISELQIDMETRAFLYEEYPRVEEMLQSECFVYHKEKTQEWERFIGDPYLLERMVRSFRTVQEYEASIDLLLRVLRSFRTGGKHETSNDQLLRVLLSLEASHVCQTNGMIFVNYPESAHMTTALVDGSTTVKLSNQENKIFMMLSRDFFIAHDSKEQETYVLVPGSPTILIQDNEIDLSTFVGRVPIHQIYLIARRLHQFTNAELSFNCFAKLEKELMVEKGLVPWKFDIFNGVKIELPPSLLSSLASYEIGFLHVPNNNYYNLSINVLGEIVGLEKSESKITNPVLLSSVNHDDIEKLPSLTDHFDVAIGGGHHVHVDIPSLGNYESAPDPGCVTRQKGRAHNLAYIPQNDSLFQLHDRKFCRKSMKELYETCKYRLKYGEQLSDAIRKCVAEEFMTDASKDYFTFAEAQKLLLSKWARLTDANCQLFTIWKGKRMTNGWSLLLHNDELYVVRSTRPTATSFTAGLSMLVYAGIEKSQGPSKLTEDTRVTNLYDAIVKVAGSVHDLDKHTNSEPEWYKPKEEKMEELLGAMLLVCTFLRGRVKATGMFAEAASISNKQNAQEVDFNIPVPLGLACSTLSTELQPFGEMRETHDLGDDRMVLRRPKSCLTILTFVMNYNYTLPLILGGDEGHGELLRALRNSVKSDEELPREQAYTSLSSRINRFFQFGKYQASKEKKHAWSQK